MPIDLRQELIKLLVSEGLGRVGLLRKTSGEAPVSTGGEWDPSDTKYWEGRNYLDWEVYYYWTPTMSAQIKTVLGMTTIADEVIFIAAGTGVPAPTTKDGLVVLKYSEDGVLFEKNGVGTRTYVIDSSIGIVSFDSVLRYWEDTNSQMTFYACSSSKLQTGYGGRA